jgi:hypothetical protein
MGYLPTYPKINRRRRLKKNEDGLIHASHLRGEG